MRLFVLGPASSPEPPSLGDLSPPDRFLGSCPSCGAQVMAKDNSITVHGDVFHNNCAVSRSGRARGSPSHTTR